VGKVITDAEKHIELKQTASLDLDLRIEAPIQIHLGQAGQHLTAIRRREL
jgi:hypothetical protein